MAKTKFCDGISDISDSYMGFIIDQWGTLHDGESLFPECLATIKELRERKKTIVILSNSMARAEDEKAKLKKMGLTPSLYDKIITPAEVLWQGFAEQKDGPFHKLGKRAYVFTRGGNVSLLEGTGVEAVDDIEQADFVLILGNDYPRKTLADYEPVIRRAIQRRLKAFTLVQDSLSQIGMGLLMGPEIIARRYADSGGIVHYVGKPYPIIFQECIKFFQKKDVYPSHTVMLGDTMGHDMIGADAQGIDTCLFKSGLHAANFAHCQNPKEVNNALKNLMAVYNNVMPKYLVDEMKWGKGLPDRKHKKRKQPIS